MTHARDAALAALVRVERDGAFAAAALESELAQVDDSRDAALAHELVLGVLRRRPWLDRLLETAATRGLDGLDPTVRLILRLAVYQLVFLDRIPARAAVSEAVTQTKRSHAAGLAGLVNALLRNLAGRSPAELSPPPPRADANPRELATTVGMPTWLFERLIALRGRDDALALARAFNGPSPRTLRVNTGRVSRDELLARLAPGARPAALSPLGLVVDDHRASRELEVDGVAAYQDEGAQLTALAVAPRADEQILDACAGRGGKTAALAVLADGRVSIVAADRQPSKLERLAFELERQGLAARTVAVDLAAEGAAVGGPFDRVLLDAPCSGTGTIGRRPEIRWRLRSRDVEQLTSVQARLLDAVAALVRPGGRLVYAVCSILPEEGAGHAAPFLERHPDFALVPEPPANWPAAVDWRNGQPLVDPVTHGCDGYSILCLERR